MRYFATLGLLFLICACSRDAAFVIEQDPFKVKPIDIESKALIEVFSGEWTPQHLNASATIEDLANDDHNVFVIVYHDDDFLEGPITEFAKNNIYNSIPYYSAGCVNRRVAQNTTNSEDGQILYNHVNWSENVALALARPAEVAIAIESKVNALGQLSGQVHLYSPELNGSNWKLQYYLTENGINAQNQIGTPNGQFIHNNVCRDIIGTPIGTNISVSAGNIESITIPERDVSSYDLSQTQLIAVLYNSSWKPELRNVVNVQACLAGGSRLWN